MHDCIWQGKTISTIFYLVSTYVVFNTGFSLATNVVRLIDYSNSIAYEVASIIRITLFVKLLSQISIIHSYRLTELEYSITKHEIDLGILTIALMQSTPHITECGPWICILLEDEGLAKILWRPNIARISQPQKFDHSTVQWTSRENNLWNTYPGFQKQVNFVRSRWARLHKSFAQERRHSVKCEVSGGARRYKLFAWTAQLKHPSPWNR